MRTAPTWLLVARREAIVKLTDKWFIGSMILTLALMALSIVLPALLGGDSAPKAVVTTSDKAAVTPVVDALNSPLDEDERIGLTTVDDEKGARTAVESGDADVWLSITDEGLVATTEDGSWSKAVEAGLVYRNVQWQANAQAAGVDLTQVLDAKPVVVKTLDPSDVRDENSEIVTTVLSFGSAMFFYLMSLVVGMMVAQSVVQEKQSRLVEIMATSVNLRDIVLGKVLGNMFVALLQIAVVVVGVYFGLQQFDFGEVIHQVSSGLAWFGVFFAVGYFGISCLWAITGALANSMEDLQATTMPMTLLIIGVFFGSLMLPDGLAREVLMYVPPASLILMPQALFQGDAQWWQAAISLAIAAAASVAALFVATRMYSRAILMTGGKVSLAQAWKARV